MMALGRMQGDPFRRASTKKYSSFGEFNQSDSQRASSDGGGVQTPAGQRGPLCTSTHSGASSLAEDALAAALLSEVVDGSANEDVLATHCARLDR